MGDVSEFESRSRSAVGNHMEHLYKNHWIYNIVQTGLFVLSRACNIQIKSNFGRDLNKK